MQIHLIQDFNHNHEKQMFMQLAERLEGIDDPRRPAHLFGNFLVGGRELDALYVRSGAIAVIEMKGHEGEIIFHENGPWFVGGVPVPNRNGPNPLRQCKTYRSEIINLLAREGNGGALPRWDHTSATVCFRGPVTLQEDIPGTLRLWFSVCDLDTVAAALGSINKPTLQIPQQTLDRVIQMIGGGLPPRPIRNRLRLLEYNGSDFSRSRNHLVGQTGEPQIAINIFSTWRDQARQGRNPLANSPYEVCGEIENSRIYRLSENYRLAVIATDDLTLHLGLIGTGEDVANWADANQGLTFTLDPVTGQFAPTFINPAPDISGDLPPEPGLQIFGQHTGLNISLLGLPGLVRRELERLTPAASPHDLQECLEAVEAVSDASIRQGIDDVIRLLLGGRPAEAKDRFDLLVGAQVQVRDAPELAADLVTSSANSETLVDLVEISDEEYEHLFDPLKFQDWMRYLHPGQFRVVNEDYPNSSMLRGVSGSGKTCVLIHRAARFAKEGKKVLILTLNRGLAKLIQHNLCNLDGKTKAVVMAYYDYIAQLLQYMGLQDVLQSLMERAGMGAAAKDYVDQYLGRLEQLFCSREDLEIQLLWREFHQINDTTRFPELHRLEVFLESQSPGLDSKKYLYEELMLVRSAHRIQNRYKTYFKYDRPNRAIALQDNRREVVLMVLQAWERFLFSKGRLDDMAFTQIAQLAVSDRGGIPNELRYDHVLVDEFQDFCTLDMEILRQIPLEKGNGLFLTGDAAQKVFTKELNLTAASLARAERTDRAIRKNYRNTREVLESASKLPTAFPPPQNASDGNELLDPEFSIKHGPKPHVHTSDDQVWAAWKIAAERIQLGYPEGSICIASCDTSRHSLSSICAAKPSDTKCGILDKDYQIDFEQVVVSDLASIKGFEFAVVLVVGLDSDRFPTAGMPSSELWREALRLYVGMTRARLELHLFHGGTPSRFIDCLGDTVIHVPKSKTAEAHEFSDKAKALSGVERNVTPQLEKLDLNGYRMVHIPTNLTQQGLADVLGLPRTSVELACQQFGAFLTPKSFIRPHIVLKIVKYFRRSPTRVFARSRRATP